MLLITLCYREGWSKHCMALLRTWADHCRSEATPILLHDRQLHYYNRERLLQSEVFRQLQNVVVQDKRRASKEMLCLILWGLARLRANPNVPPTPPVAVVSLSALTAYLHTA